MSAISDIRVVVGLDFGTTYSGFTLCHVDDDDDLSKIKTNTEWPGEMGKFKTNTVLQYDNDFREVELWGYPALCKRPNRRSRDSETKPVELFKLFLGSCLEKYKPKLPGSLTYKQAITDYLKKIGELIKETIPKFWDGIDFMEHILIVITVPAEYSENDKAIMRECTFNAGLIGEKNSEKLQFTTEPEAAAIYCMYSSLREYRLTEPGTTFMIVDCGGGTVDLTTRKLLEENQLAVVRGAAIYGKSLQKSRNLGKLNNSKCVIATRVLKHTFGTKISPSWKPGDPPERLTFGGRIQKFHRIAERRTEVTIDQEFKIEDLVPVFVFATKMTFDIYYTHEQDAVYCDDPGYYFMCFDHYLINKQSSEGINKIKKNPPTETDASEVLVNKSLINPG
ncbi:unnamed protein product [Rhizophagus irregularis]|uniref:Actin-like ATPase domain-containing protein n=1 Tax=Rhizophagus irregularis TaxID=588596 RepID=A0A916EGS1_9GLOM|nr:unnamed protein product [Rhizophagus irregularis]